jgi:hypothetical protein
MSAHRDHSHDNRELQGRDQKLFAHKALQRTPITFFSREIHSSTFRRSANNHFAETGNGVGSVSNGNGK